MSGIGLEICEIVRILRNKNDFVWMVKPMATCKILFNMKPLKLFKNAQRKVDENQAS